MHGAIEDPQAVAEAIEGADAVVNFAAETHVDRSISEPDAFVRTHALGTFVLLEEARRRGIRYLQVSTDEVYGSIEDGSFTEQSPLEPSSPYSATKTGADLLVQSYTRTYGMETVICRGSNNYGPYQYPEKLIPLMILNAMHGDRLPVYGDGMQVRNWIHVTDFARAIGHVLEHGDAGEVYNAGGPDECPNIEVVSRIIELTGADADADRARHRPPRPRPPLLAQLRQGARARLGAARALRRRARRDRRLVPREQRLVGADPLGRVPRLLRAPVRPRARLLARWLDGSLEIFQAPATLRRPTVSSRDAPSPSLARTTAVASSPLTRHAAHGQVGLVGVLERALHRRDAGRGVAALGDLVAQLGDDRGRRRSCARRCPRRRSGGPRRRSRRARCSPVKSEDESLLLVPPAQPASASTAIRLMPAAVRMRRAA